MSSMRILRASDRALLVETADLDEAMRLTRALTAAAVPGLLELVPGARTVLVRFEPRRVSAEALSEIVGTIDASADVSADAALVEIPVHYDGDDLADVADVLGISVEDVIARHLAASWTVAFAGFAPGFGYLIGDDPLFDVPRRATPRMRVPAGAVGLAGRFSGVYPRESPGGWQLIGRTDAVMWDTEREPPALLAPGTQVRFVRAARLAAPASPQDASLIARPPQPHRDDSQRRIDILSALFPILIQDLGRPGNAALGVSASGIADRTAMRAANRAVGNAPDAAVLEITAGGAALKLTGALVVAVAGAVGELVLTDRHGEERPAPHGAPFAVFDGDVLQVGAPERGLRSVLAVRGGIRSRPVLGSLATDTLAGLGPAPLRAGDAVALGDPRSAPHLVDPVALPRDLPAPGETVTLEITLGPRDDWFTADALEALTGQEWEVTARGDRVGIRLAGAEPLQRSVQGELPSEGAVTGALQVPPDGQPVLFLPDHPLTGGYPIIGAVTDECLDLAAQLPPGVRVRFAVR